MADITLGKIKFEFKGKYGAGTTYYKDDVVVYDHMKFIYVNASSGSGNAPLILDTVSGWDYAFPNINPDDETALKKYRLNSDYWEYFEDDTAFGEYLGNWSSSTTYDIGDVVTGEYGACYYAVRKSVDDRPELNRYGSWQLLIEGGYVPHERRISRLGPNINPIGWRGHPKFTITEWTAVGGDDWNGNIPPALSTAEVNDDWITDVGSQFHSGFSHTAWDGRPAWVSSTGQYGGPRGYTNSKGGTHMMPHEVSQQLLPFWNASLVSAPWWAGPEGDNNNYEVNANNYSHNIDFYTTAPTTDPTAEPFGSSTPRIIQMINLGGYHSTGILYSDGSLYIQGYLGYMHTAEFYPSGIDYGLGFVYGRDHFGGKRIVKVASGFGISGDGTDNGQTHVLMLDEDGNLWVMGANGYGQCGIGPQYSYGTSAFQTTDSILDSGGFDYSYATAVDAPTCISLNTDPTGEFHFDGQKIVDIWAAGGSFGISYALTEDGRIWSWGYNGYGQLGFPTDSGSVSTTYSPAPKEVGGADQTLDWADYNGIQKFIVEGTEQYTTCYLLDGDGHMWTWGYGSVARLGNGVDSAGTDNTITLNATDHKRTNWTGLAGSIKNFWTTNFYTTSVNNLWIKKTDNTLWGMSENGQYQLLTGTATDQFIPIQADEGIDDGHVVKVSGVSDSTQCNIFALTTTGKIYVIPMGVMPNGFGAIAHSLISNYNVHQRVGEDQYSWKSIALPRGLRNTTIIDIRSETQYHTEGSASYVDRVFTALTEDGRMYMMSNGGGGGSAMGIQTGTAGVGPTNAVWWGS